MRLQSAVSLYNWGDNLYKSVAIRERESDCKLGSFLGGKILLEGVLLASMQTLLLKSTAAMGGLVVLTNGGWLIPHRLVQGQNADIIGKIVNVSSLGGVLVCAFVFRKPCPIFDAPAHGDRYRLCYVTSSYQLSYPLT